MPSSHPAEIATLRALRAQCSIEGRVSLLHLWLRSAGVVYLAYIRDELPEPLQAEVDALWAANGW